ncbi:MAG: UDP-N-acetylglucosamine 2-epimerase (non-hydrolyzing) [Tenericutes bacterium]|nr:UDP-N-acetylglucosamine 2-epimerase (non-hydrolyzing) [Mycoplasmatota bacterium]
MKILTVIGARPQFIKAASFSELFRKNNTEILVHTGQHYDFEMSELLFSELKLPKPDYNLNVGSRNHGEQIAKMLEEIEKILYIEKPQGVLLYGDTNSTLAGALAASKLNIPIFHIEAGLRSYNKKMPEEQNRIITDHLSSLLFCPTQTAVDNLKREGLSEGVIYTGDIMYDAILRNMKISQEKYSFNKGIEEIIYNSLKRSDCLFKEDDYYLATIHRAENTDDRVKLKKIIESFDKMNKIVVMPIHPRTRNILDKMNIKTQNIIFVKPVGYLLMLYLISKSCMVITDSGGVQKEAFLLNKPCTTLRDETEWVETLKNNWNALCSIKQKTIIDLVQRDTRHLKISEKSVFGNGNTTEIIVNSIIKYGGNSK